MNPIDKIDLYEFCVRDECPPPKPTVGVKHDPARKAWFGEHEPRRSQVYAVAFDAQDYFSDPFTPDQPRLDVQITVP